MSTGGVACRNQYLYLDLYFIRVYCSTNSFLFRFLFFSVHSTLSENFLIISYAWNIGIQREEGREILLSFRNVATNEEWFNLRKNRYRAEFSFPLLCEHDEIVVAQEITAFIRFYTVTYILVQFHCFIWDLWDISKTKLNNFNSNLKHNIFA